ncbi:increased DNA methylation 1-like isoform X2 [Pistacia vera]|uniref:increased DNA methylation 1-like isoform X2 n=1 Tax=Pistacia vera TaxID=55513 RepID=UPI001262E672|nr:increased DNA methylation 1-like isoform X2 [Pistacia vera]
MKMISEWPCGVRSVWNRYFMDVVYEIAIKLSRRDLGYRKILSYLVGKKGNKSKDSQHASSNSFLCDSLIQARNRKAMSYKVRKKGNKSKGNKSKDSQHAVLNSHLCDSLVKVRNHNEFKVTRASQKGGEDSHGKCNKKQQSPSSKSEDKKQSITNTTDQNGFEANNLCREKDMTTGPSFIENTTVGKGVYDRSSNSGSCLHHVVNCVSFPTQKKPDQVESNIEKLNSAGACEGDHNKLLSDSSREEKTAQCLHHIQKYQSVKRRRTLRKRSFNNKLVMVFTDCLEKQKDKKASFFVVHKRRNCSIMKKRELKKSQQVNSKLKLTPKVQEQGLNAVRTRNSLFSNSSRPTMPFEKYGKNFRLKDMVSNSRKRKMKRGYCSGQLRDTICSVCHHWGDLILCDHCPSSYHLSCLDLKDCPGRNWFCPACRCGLCGLRDSNEDNQQFTNMCFQCTRRYHVTCLIKAGSLSPTNYPSDSFCTEACFKLCAQLHRLLGISNPTAVDGLTWTLMRSMRSACNPFGISRIDSCIKLSSILQVIHDCFEPVKEPHTNRDIVRDVIFNSMSKLKRLDFRGFYAMVLHKGDEIVSVATVRIHGFKVAEMPLVATPFQYRRQGMCRLLLHELEKLLIQLGVERLVLPSILQLQKTWEDSFGFSELLHSQRRELFGYPFLAFPGTKMLQKFLSNSSTTQDINGLMGTSRDFDRNTSVVSLSS